MAWWVEAFRDGDHIATGQWPPDFGMAEAITMRAEVLRGDNQTLSTNTQEDRRPKGDGYNQVFHR